MKEYKLFNTDGKTFFDFRSDPESRCEGFTISYLDDGTVCMSGDYGTLTWKRYGNGSKYDYGFPNKETGIRYFEEKVCQWGVKQVVEEWNSEKAKKDIEEYLRGQYDVLRAEDNLLSEDERELKQKLVDFIDSGFETEVEMHRALSDLDNDLGDNNDFWEGHYGIKYTEQFEFMFKLLQSVSDQVWDAVKKQEVTNAI